MTRDWAEPAEASMDAGGRSGLADVENRQGFKWNCDASESRSRIRVFHVAAAKWAPCGSTDTAAKDVGLTKVAQALTDLLTLKVRRGGGEPLLAEPLSWTHRSPDRR